MVNVKSSVVVCGPSDLESFGKIASGEANAVRPHLAVPLYTPITEIPSDRYDNVSTKWLERGFQPIAAAKGFLCEGKEKYPLHMTLCWSSPEKTYFTYDSEGNEVECAVLMDGSGRRYDELEELYATP